MLTGVLLTMLLILADGKERNRTDTQGMLEITNESTDRFSAKEQRSDGTYNRHLRDLVEKLATKLINEKIQTKITKFDENSSIDMQTLDEQTFDGKSNVEWVFIGSDDNATNSNNTNIHRQVFGERYKTAFFSIFMIFIVERYVDEQIPQTPDRKIEEASWGESLDREEIRRIRAFSGGSSPHSQGRTDIRMPRGSPQSHVRFFALIFAIFLSLLLFCSDMRYFMCSGAILTQRLVITTASCLQLAIFYE